MLFKYSFEIADSEEKEMFIFSTGTYLIKIRNKEQAIIKKDVSGENIGYFISPLDRPCLPYFDKMYRLFISFSFDLKIHFLKLTKTCL